MKAAAAVLVASLLFFAGVLTGADRRAAVAPPAPIPLGMTAPARPGGPSTPGRSPAEPAAPPAGQASTTTTAARPDNGPAPAPAPTPLPAAPAATATTATTAATPGPTTTATATTTSTGSGGVEQVDNRIECSQTGKRGGGRRSPCPSTTSSTAATANASPENGGRGPAGR